MNEILDFIKHRFPTDCKWTTGNCYYFSQILLSRFPTGVIYYDVINGHFVTLVDGKYYDWTGCVKPDVPIKWDEFDKYDNTQKQVIIRDCIM